MTRHLAYPHLVGSVPDCAACQDPHPAPMAIGPRGQVYIRPPVRRKDTTSGTARVWARTINGHRYSFTVMLMPSGERRFRVARQTTTGWERVHAWEVQSVDRIPA